MIKARYFLNIYSISTGLTLNRGGPMIFLLILILNMDVDTKIILQPSGQLVKDNFLYLLIMSLDKKTDG